MNQFVPQLMLGNALANSTNFPDFDPRWIQLDSWHIGAQYFMGLCPDGVSTKCKSDWIARAATGKLIPVEPGEVIETSIGLQKYDGNRSLWILSIGVLGQADRTSQVIVHKPFMGLLNKTIASADWMDYRYSDVFVGSCLENYGMRQRENFPNTWDMDIRIYSEVSGWQEEWSVNNFHRCDGWNPPMTNVESWNTSFTSQSVHWTATLGKVGTTKSNIQRVLASK